MKYSLFPAGYPTPQCTSAHALPVVATGNNIVQSYVGIINNYKNNILMTDDAVEWQNVLKNLTVVSYFCGL